MNKHGMNTNPKVIVAMSGGVDSSVSALLLKEKGYDVTGITMRLWAQGDSEVIPAFKSCCSVSDVEDARQVCQILDIPHYVMNLEREFQTFVIDYFTQEYHDGRTPYPCLACNDRLKFDFLLNRGLLFGADYVATGHYARLTQDEEGNHLFRAKEPFKDQSYVLFGMGQQQLGQTLMPIGWYSKTEVRDLAREAGLPTADKIDSQDICFIPNGNYREFLAERIPDAPGNIVNIDGEIVGNHRGVHNFTVGQRQGLGINGGPKRYVVSLDPEKRQVTVGAAPDLLQRELTASQVNWISGTTPTGPVLTTAKIRYKSPESHASVWPLPDNRVKVRFSEPQRAVTPGQPVVFYQNDEVVGGGIIEGSLLKSNQEPEIT